jgi:FixJ family two-component response regulator
MKRSIIRLAEHTALFYRFIVLRIWNVKLPVMPLISIVDDDKSVREATKSLVRSLGYNAETFGSAEEFLGSAYVTATACLITDIQMPGLSGIGLFDHLIADGHDIPVIFVTAFPDDRLQSYVDKKGAIGYLPKPFKEGRMVECIDAALRSRGGQSARH